jgi:Putative Flp pilus-assembly TadE/G-like
MCRHLHHLRHDERGMSLVFVSVAFMALLSATTLAIDVGMFMNARSQAQNAADAGALAGAVGLASNSWTDRSSTGPAVVGAVNTALANRVGGVSVSVTPDDVTFPVGPTGQSNRVAVQVFRTGGRSNPVPTLMGGFFGVQTVDVAATATAEVSPANAMTCVKPFMIPDRWQENTTPPWTTSSTFDKYDNHGNLLANPDVYRDANQTDYTGYTTVRDVGMQLTLRAGTGSNINPSFYYSWKMPGDIGGDFYRNNIADCNQSTIVQGTLIIQEPGDKSGPTVQGISDLVAKDPGAYWDTICKCVKGSAFSVSPRVFPIPLYDPDYYADGKANGRPADFKIANFLGFFAEPPVGNSIPGRITQIVGLVDPTAGNVPLNAFAKTIRLVQ